MEPRQIGRYLIQERLGQGGMGTVYRALDPQVNRPVALKTIPIDDPERRARFQREVWAAGRLIHPNIVILFDAGEDGNSAYLAMELIEGETLAAHLHQGLPWRQTVVLLIPICQALHYAHSQGIIHRDLKPANILVTPQGIPKLSDFGLAHVAAETTLTPPGVALGTPGYAAPEQVRGKSADGRSDLFSLGIILFEAIAGRHPFQADSLGATLYQIANDEPVDLGPLAGKAPPALVHVIERVLAKDREARFATGEELAAALSGCLSEDEVGFDILLPTTSSAYPEVRHTPSVALAETEMFLLARAFPDSEEVFVERELAAGFSGARVLLVRPGRDKAQVVVKLGFPSDLKREWEAYQVLVEATSSQNTARVQGEPILSDDGRRALLRYTFAGGDPRRPTRGLQTYYQERGGAAAAEVLDRLIRVYGQQWWSRNIPRTFALGEEYDRLLPVHLKLRPELSEAPGPDRPETSLFLAAGTVNPLALRALQPGQHVRLLDFSVSEVRPGKRDMTLMAPPRHGEASAHLRLRVEDIDTAGYHPGDCVGSLDAVVTATRSSVLGEAAQAAMPGLDWKAADIRLGDVICPNPLNDYTDLLDCVMDARFSIIHGDLNLENILVDSATGFAWLIDFAETRHGPALYDLQRLEAQVVTKLLSAAVARPGLGPEVMVRLYQALHAELPDPTPPHPALQEAYTLLVTIRRLARHFLMNDVDWDEYYRGLILTLLGTLKFDELKAMARALAFAGAAVARKLIGTSLPEMAVPLRLKSASARHWSAVVGLMSLPLVIVVAALGWLLLHRENLSVPNPRNGPSEAAASPILLVPEVATPTPHLTATPLSSPTAPPTATATSAPTPTAAPTATLAGPSETPPGSMAWQESFDDREGFLKRWESFANGGTVAAGEGFLSLSSGANTAFPYVRMRRSPFPARGDFALEMEFQYTRVGDLGTGIVLGLASPENGSPVGDKPDPNVEHLKVWQDSQYYDALVVGAPDTIMASLKSPDTDRHDVQVLYAGGQINVSLDHKLIWQGPETAARPTTLWLGNPYRTPQPGNWSELRVFSIAVKSSGTSPRVNLPSTTAGIILDDFESYSADSLQQTYTINNAWSKNDLSADVTTLADAPERGQVLRLAYNIKAMAPDHYVGFERALPVAQDWSGFSAVQFWARNGPILIDLIFQWREGPAWGSEVWKTNLSLQPGETRLAEIPLTSQFFRRAEWSPAGNGQMNLDQVSYYAFFVEQGQTGSGTLYLDSIQLIPGKTSPAPLATAQPPPAPTCSSGPVSEFQALWSAHSSELGCPTGPLSTLPLIAEEAFEGGHLFWRQDTDDVYLVYDRRKDGAELFAGQWTMPPWKWDEIATCQAGTSPPPGLRAPERGFGWLWCTHLGGPDGPLGWALDREYGRENVAIVQAFEHGLMFRASDPKVYALLDGGRFYAQR